MTQTTPNFSEDSIRKAVETPTFDQPVVLRQSPMLSRAVVWTILGVTTATITWAAIGTIEQVATATGQLQPQGEVEEIQAPINGVVREVLVKDNERVKRGQDLLIFDSETAATSKTSLTDIQTSLTQENQLYRAVLSTTGNTQALQQQIAQFKLPPEVTALALNRLALINEIQVLQAQIGSSSGSLNQNQSARVAAGRQEAASRISAANLEFQQLEQRLAQTKVQLADAQAQLKIDRQILTNIGDRNQKIITETQKILNSETRILEAIEPLVKEGVVAELQADRQQQQVNERRAQLIEQESTGKIELEQQQQRVDSRRAEIAQLTKEEQRLQLDIRQAQAELTNAKSSIENTLREQLDNAQQRLATVDSELNKLIVENTKQLSEIRSQLAQANETLNYQTIKAPIDGTVFDLKATSQFVYRVGQPEPLLKIVPSDTLIAEVFITNKDIGAVLTRCLEKKVDAEDLQNQAPEINDKNNNPVPTTLATQYSECTNKIDAYIKIDSFSFSQYGGIPGEVISVSPYSLPPDEIHPYYRFPAKIRLKQQSLEMKRKGKVIQELPLQAGMSVNVNITVREKRSILSLFVDFLYEKQQALKES